LGTSAFWTLMAIGRFGAAGLRRLSVSPIVILVSATSTAAVLMVVAGLLVAPAPAGALVALAAVVVLLAPSYGLILGLALDRLDPTRSAAVTGALVACGAVGGTFVPTLILAISRDPASSTTFFVSAGLCALVPALMLVASRTPPQTPGAS
jgi:fucose permease